MKIKRMTLIDTRKGRRIELRLSSGSKITITGCCDGYQQGGGTLPELSETVAVAELYNGWLHGGELPGIGNF